MLCSDAALQQHFLQDVGIQEWKTSWLQSSRIPA